MNLSNAFLVLVMMPTLIWTQSTTKKTSPSTPRIIIDYGPTQIRVQNGSDVDFKDVKVGHKKYGDIKAGATTDYQAWESAYGYTFVSLLAGSRSMVIRPIDYVGEPHLGHGYFTYVLTIEKDRLEIRAEKDTTPSPAPGGRSTTSHFAQSGIISTVAGNGTVGFSGDGGPATSAQLYHPYGFAVDAAGNLFIADTSNNRVRKVTPSGVISTVAGNGTRGFSGDGGPATSAQLNSLSGVAVDTAGNVFIADTQNDRIRMVTLGASASAVFPQVAVGGGLKPYGVGSDVIKPPIAIYKPNPAYTAEALKKRVEGVVVLHAVIRANGEVDSLKVIKRLGFGLDESAIKTIATKWRFKPGTINGVPVDVRANFEVFFRLDK